MAEVDTTTPGSTKPYLVRAIHEWCTDNGLTPYLAVSVTDQVRVPPEHVRHGEIVLNVGVLATDKLMMDNDAVSFQARFSGRVHEIYIPMENVVAIYAKETGNGMAFEVPKPLAHADLQLAAVDQTPTEGAGDADGDSSDDTPEPPHRPPAGRPRLTRVK
jgi:stringent starvation protein B